MAQIDPLPLPIAFVDSSATAAAIPVLGLSQLLSKQEQEFLNRLPEPEQQKLLQNCTDDQQLHLHIQQAMKKQ